MPPAAPTRRYRRATDFTALRLGRAVLGYLSVVVAIITLAPFRFEWPTGFALSTVWGWPDLVLNVLLFAPLGFVYQLTRPQGAPADWWRGVLLAAALSGAIEVAQLFAPTRYPSLFDLATNTGGALLGVWSCSRLAPRVHGEVAVRSLALELPLMGLVYLLIPLCWLIGFGSESEARRLLVLGPGVVAGVIMGTVHAAYLHPAHPRWWLAVTTLGWAAVAFLPGAAGNPVALVPGMGLVLTVASLRAMATKRAMVRDASERNRRFELPTLRLVLPLFAVYLTASAVWPLAADGGRWQGTLALMLPGTIPFKPVVLRALELVAAFTLVGYMSAESRGRDPQRGARALGRTMAWCLPPALLLQLARGFYAEAGASLLLFALTLLAAGFGHVLYMRQRDHIQALVQRRTLLARHATTGHPRP